VRESECIAAGYFVYLGLLAWIVPLPSPRRRQSLSIVAPVLVLLAVAPHAGESLVARTLRDWLPAAYLLAGYVLSGLFFVAPMPWIEARLAAWDRRLFAAIGLRGFVARAPRLLLESLEASYVGTNVLIPGALLGLVAGGAGLHVDRFWSMVLLAEFGSFGMMPWIQTRPPWVLETADALDRRGLLVRQVNGWIVRRWSHRANTCPSGHVSGVLAAAIAVSVPMPVLGGVLFACAAWVAVGAVVGRYHYAADAVAGGALAVAGALAVTAWGR
jgi:hypothetical protein